MKGMVDAKRGEVVMTFSLALYRREAIESAASLLSRQAECFEEGSPKGGLRVVLKPSGPADRAALERLAGDFVREALVQEHRLDAQKAASAVQAA